MTTLRRLVLFVNVRTYQNYLYSILYATYIGIPVIVGNSRFIGITREKNAIIMVLVTFIGRGGGGHPKLYTLQPQLGVSAHLNLCSPQNGSFSPRLRGENTKNKKRNHLHPAPFLQGSLNQMVNIPRYPKKPPASQSYCPSRVPYGFPNFGIFCGEKKTWRHPKSPEKPTENNISHQKFFWGGWGLLIFFVLCNKRSFGINTWGAERPSLRSFSHQKSWLGILVVWDSRGTPK